MHNPYLKANYPIPPELAADYPSPPELKTAIKQAICNGQKQADEMVSSADNNAIAKMMGINSDYKKDEETMAQEEAGVEAEMLGNAAEALSMLAITGGQ